MQTLSNLKERTKWAIDQIAQKHNLTEANIGSAVGSKPDTVRKYRAGQATPRITFLTKFCEVYGTDFQWLFSGIGDPFHKPDTHSLDGPDAPERGACPSFGFQKNTVHAAASDTIVKTAQGDDVPDLSGMDEDERNHWVTAVDQNRTAPAKQKRVQNISRLLEIAEEVLRSDTIQATSLATNILSMKSLADKKHSSPIQGASAIKLSERDAPLF